MRDGNFGSVANKSVELGGDVHVEPDTAMGAWTVFHPTCMNAIVRLELTPVGHGCSFEAPSTGFAAEIAFFNVSTAVGKSMAVGAVVVVFFENAECSSWGRSAGCAYGCWCD